MSKLDDAEFEEDVQLSPDPDEEPELESLDDYVEKEDHDLDEEAEEV